MPSGSGRSPARRLPAGLGGAGPGPRDEGPGRVLLRGRGVTVRPADLLNEDSLAALIEQVPADSV